MKKILFPLVVLFIGILCSSSKADDGATTTSDDTCFTLWNTCDALTALQDYV